MLVELAAANLDEKESWLAGYRVSYYAVRFFFPCAW